MTVRLGGSYWRLWTASVISNVGDGISAVAYPWLASAVTRNPLWLAGIAVAQRLPWLIFTLPAGVLTDRLDRRRIIVSMDVARWVITLVVAIVVLLGQSTLPSPADIETGVFETGPGAFLVLLYAASLLLGFAEVLRDNSAQTILPAIVEPEGLERANGNLWSAEMVANSFVGPPVGGLLLAAAFAVPFLVDAGTFAVAAGLVLLIAGDFRPGNGAEAARIAWGKEIGEGVRWLWRHPLLRPMAIILGLMNGLSAMAFATFVFFAQEVLMVGAFVFGILGTGGALGGVLGGILGPRVSKALGSGPSLYLTIVVGALTSVAIGVTSLWPVVWLMELAFVFVAILWNIITVSLRQTIIPDGLLGRVNSVYRLLGWGSMPLGALIGGAVVAIAEPLAGREAALRLPWFLSAAALALILLYAAPRLTTEKIETSRAEAVERRERAAEQAMGEAGVGGVPPPAEDEDM